MGDGPKQNHAFRLVSIRSVVTDHLSNSRHLLKDDINSWLSKALSCRPSRTLKKWLFGVIVNKPSLRTLFELVYYFE